MPSTETKIWMALKAHVETQPLTYAVAWPAQEFTRPSRQSPGAPAGVTELLPYIQVENLSNDPDRFLQGSDAPDNRRGILTMALMFPVAGKHSNEFMLERGAMLAAHFHKGLTMRYQGVTVKPEASPRVVEPYRDDAYWRLPVLVRWQALC